MRVRDFKALSPSAQNRYLPTEYYTSPPPSTITTRKQETSRVRPAKGKKGINLSKDFKKTFSSLYSGIQLQEPHRQSLPSRQPRKVMAKSVPLRITLPRPRSVQTILALKPLPRYPTRYKPHHIPPLSPRPVLKKLVPAPSVIRSPHCIVSHIQSTGKKDASTLYSQTARLSTLSCQMSERDFMRSNGMGSFLDQSGYGLISNIIKEPEIDLGRAGLGEAKQTESILIGERTFSQYYHHGRESRRIA